MAQKTLTHVLVTTRDLAAEPDEFSNARGHLDYRVGPAGELLVDEGNSTEVYAPEVWTGIRATYVDATDHR